MLTHFFNNMTNVQREDMITPIRHQQQYKQYLNVKHTYMYVDLID